MKKALLILSILASALSSTQATSIFSDDFNYPDGGLMTNAPGVWFPNTGIAGSLLVSAGQLQVFGDTSGRTEDTFHYLQGGANIMTNSGTVLYSSFTATFLSLPSGAGTYFAHFGGTNDAGTSLTGYRARVWAAATNAATGALTAAGKFALYIVTTSPGSVTNGNNQWPVELDTNVTYTIVTRYNVGTSESTLWVGTDPGSLQESVGGVTDAIYFPANYGSSGPINIVAYDFRQAIGEGNILIDNLKVGTTFADVAGTSGGNAFPSLVPPGNQSVPANTTIGPLNFTVQDAETPAIGLNVTAASSNTGLVPNGAPNLVLSTNDLGGTNRSITIVPLANQEGVSTITISVSDGTNTTSGTFKVTVGKPSFTTTSLSNQIVPMNSPATPTAALPFTVWDNESPNSLIVTGASSNPGLIPPGNIVISGVGTNRTVTVTPVAGTNGYSIITLTVTDPSGQIAIMSPFYVTVYPQIGVVLNDDFNYPDGPFPTDGTYQWLFNPAGTGYLPTNDVFIVSGRLQNAYTNYDDINAQFTNANGRITFNIGNTNDALSVPASYAGGVLYAKFRINCVVLPFEQGTYFAGFQAATSTTLKGRVAITNGVAAGTYRIGVSAATTLPSAIFPRDLDLNTTHIVVVRYVVPTGDTTLWIDPFSESSESVTCTDTTTGTAMGRYQFRQASGTNYSPGVFYVDDLVVGTAFSNVASSVLPALKVSKTGGQVLVEWSDSRFKVYSSSSLIAPVSSWTLVPGISPISITPAGGSQQFYILKYQP